MIGTFIFRQSDYLTEKLEISKYEGSRDCVSLSLQGERKLFATTFETYIGSRTQKGRTSSAFMHGRFLSDPPPPSDDVLSALIEDIHAECRMPSVFELLRHSHVQEATQSDDRAKLSPSHPYPAPVSTIIADLRQPARFGAFPEFDCLFCLSDTELYLWPAHSPSDFRVIHDLNAIRFVAMSRPDSRIFDRAAVKCIVIYTTDKTVHIVPIDHNWAVFDERLSRSLSFTPTAIAGPATVLFGSNDGVIYEVAPAIGGNPPALEIRSLTSTLAGAVFARWRPFALPIEAIVHDESSGCVAALYGRSELRFFEFSEGVLRELSKFENRTMFFLNIEAIPISDSAVVRFIAFTENGGRMAFGRKMQRGPIECVSQLEAVVSDRLLAGAHALTWTVFVHERSLVVLHPLWEPRIVRIDPPEVWEHIECRSPVLAYSHGRHRFCECVGSCVHSSQWQHFLDRPLGYVFCADGVCELAFDRPVDTLSRLVGRSRDWLSQFVASQPNTTEAAATAILLASLSEQSQHCGLAAFADIADMGTGRLPRGLSVAVSAFVLRTARLISPLHRIRFLRKKRSGRYGLSRPFKNVDPLKSSLAALIPLSRQYPTMRAVPSDCPHLQRLRQLLRGGIQLLTMIDTIAHSKAAFADAFESLPAEHRHRLATGSIDYSDLAALSAFADSLEYAVGAIVGGEPVDRHRPGRDEPVAQLYRELQDVLEDRTRLSRGGLATPQRLFDECCAQGFWDLVLAVVAVGTFAGDDRAGLIRHVWSRFMCEQLWPLALADARAMVAATAARIPRGSDVLRGIDVVPVLEELRVRKDGDVLWALDTMLQCGMDPTGVADAYFDGLAQSDLQSDHRCDFTYAVAVLIERGADVKGKPMSRCVEWFCENARHRQYYGSAWRLLSRLGLRAS
jgi:hypothetical protein